MKHKAWRWILAVCGLALLAGAFWIDHGRDQGSGTEAEAQPPVAPEPQPAPEEPEAPAAPTGIFGAYEEQARQVLEGMTLEEKVGQVFFVRCPAPEQLAKVQALQPGGILLFGRDFKGKDAQQVRAEIQGYQQASAIPLLIGVDEEGGTVCRVSGNEGLRAERFPSPRSLYEQGGMAAVEADVQQKNQLLRSLGIQVNLAPVADVPRTADDFIYPRAVSTDPQVVAAFVETVVRQSQAGGIGSAMKHFPGYGDNQDTHTGSAHDTRTLEELEQVDLLPFQAGIEAGGQSILVSHNVVDCLEPGVPASLSPKVHAYLREQMGFTGVIMTDDLAMGAIEAYCGQVPPAVEALNAGNDLLLVTDLPGNVAALLEGVRQGQVSQQRLDQAVLRVLEWKIALGLLER
ncbi:MAG TPA: beta-hexosaminidase [Firmicutes bacterium]|nr:beta-hexosaminidase [Bacillota bacterium]